MANKTMVELTTELETLRSEMTTNKESSAKLVEEFEILKTRRGELKTQIDALNIELKTIKLTEKAAGKEAKLAELLKAKEAAASLKEVAHSRRSVNASEAVAAHKTPNIDPLAGDLSDTVDLKALEDQLDIF